jgi:hypothetical protein
MTGRLNHWEEYRLFPKIMKTFADLKETFDREDAARPLLVT